MSNNFELLAAALADQQAGRLERAETGYRAVFERAPHVPMAAQLLGVLLRRDGRVAEALDVLRQGNTARPGDVGIHLALADTLQAANKRAAAVQVYRSLLAIDPGNTTALVNLANALRDDGDTDAAMCACREALTIAPNLVEAHATLGSVLLALGDAKEAASAYLRAVQARPEFAQGWTGLGMAHLRSNRGDLACAAADEAIRLEPRLAEGWFVRGTALSMLRQSAEAIASLERAVVLDPCHARALVNLGNVYADIDDLAQAEISLRASIATDDSVAEAHASLGFILASVGRLHEATNACEAAIALQPDFAQAHWNLSFARLLAGDFGRGWAEYEWRKRHTRFAANFGALEGAAWQGEPLIGRTLLVRAEQGLGDTIQFARYLPILATLGARVVVACDKPLIGLLATMPGVAQTTWRDQPLPAYDFWVDQMSLPRLFYTTVDTIPSAAGYLTADPVLTDAFRAALPTGRRIGLVWRGNPAHSNDARRSMRIEALAPIIAVPNATFVSLQVGPYSQEISRRFGVPDRSPDLTDFGRTAALVSALDLVIAVDTSTAHLSAALGRPTWAMIPFAPDWRWMPGRDDSPWYESMRLFRQPAPGDWTSVVERVAAALHDFLNADRATT